MKYILFISLVILFSCGDKVPKGTISYYYQEMGKPITPSTDSVKCFENRTGAMGNTQYGCYCLNLKNNIVYYLNYEMQNDKDTFDVFNTGDMPLIKMNDSIYTLHINGRNNILQFSMDNSIECLKVDDIPYPLSDSSQVLYTRIKDIKQNDYLTLTPR